jgi:hypothetical protein
MPSSTAALAAQRLAKPKLRTLTINTLRMPSLRLLFPSLPKSQQKVRKSLRLRCVLPPNVNPTFRRLGVGFRRSAPIVDFQKLGLTSAVQEFVNGKLRKIRYFSEVDPALLECDPIARWLRIRKELLPAKRSTPTSLSLLLVTRSLTRHRNASSSQLPAGAPPSTLPPSSPPPLSSLPVATSPAAYIPMPKAIFPNTAATVLAWIKDGTPPIDVIVHSRVDGRIRLSDFKVDLGRGQMFFIKYAHVKYLNGFVARLCVEHGFGHKPEEESNNRDEQNNSGDESASDLGYWTPSLLDRKGKGCAF